MARYPHQLRSELGNWQQFYGRRQDPAFYSLRDQVFRRDNYTCQYCGFQATKYQEIVNIDQNYRNNRIGNLVTACCFCAQCFFLESVGMGDYGGGTLIYMPEMEQAEVSGLCHVLFCAIVNKTDYKTSAQALYRSMKYRSKFIEEEFGEGTSEPAVFGQLLIEAQIKKAESKNDILKSLRLLPSRSKFQKQIEYWATTANQQQK